MSANKISIFPVTGKRGVNSNQAPPSNGGGNGGGGDMEQRLSEVEKATVRLETVIEAIKDNMATKTDLESSKSDIIKWTVGTALAIGAAGVTIMTFVLNNATPKSTESAAYPPPIIIQVPAVPPAATAMPSHQNK